jgi:hypothetical protein
MNRNNMPTTYSGIVALIRGRKSDSVTLCNNTVATWWPESDMVTITLHGHCIIRLFADGRTEVRHCGWPTVTTFDRIKRFLPYGWTATCQGGRPRIVAPYRGIGGRTMEYAVHYQEWATAKPSV